MGALLGHYGLLMAGSGSGGGSGDPYFANVVALLHGNGTNGSTTITDSSTSAKTYTATNGAAISTAQSKFGGASILFDGTNDYVTSASHADWAFGTGQFTVELWARFSSTSAMQVLIGNYGGANGFYIQYRTDGNGLSVGYVGTIIGSSYTPALNTWVHIAWTRDGSNAMRLFVDGTQRGATVTDGTNFSATTPLLIGGLVGSQFFSGWIDEVRITKGVARYAANFTPPTAAFPDS